METTFSAGLVPEVFGVNISSLVRADDIPEPSQGFLLYLDLNESRMNPKDVSRLDVPIRVTLITILDNDGKKQWIQYKILYYI